MQRLTIGPIFTFAITILALFSDHVVAKAGHDQIAIVIPAVQKRSANLTDTDAALISYILAQSIKRHFQRSEGANRSAVITVPAPLSDDNPTALEKLARINGAQITLS